MTPSVRTTIAEIVVSSGTQRNLEQLGEMYMDLNRSRSKLVGKLVASAQKPEMSEGNSQFLKHLEAVYNS